MNAGLNGLMDFDNGGVIGFVLGILAAPCGFTSTQLKKLSIEINDDDEK